MGDVLSQAEIDALLSALSEGQVDAEEMKESKAHKKVRVYDFKRPNKFSKDHMHTLQNIHDNFCRALTTYLSAHLHSVIETRVLSMEQITYDEFIRSLPNPTILGIFTLEPLEGTLLLEISPALAFAIIDLILGGLGQGGEKNRDLTEIERTIIERRLSQMVALFGESWAEVYATHPHFVALETNPQFTQIIAPNEMVMLVTLQISVGETVGMINVCLPYLVLEPILDKLSSFLLFAAQAKVSSAVEVEAIRRQIERAKVDLHVLLGQTQISVRELVDLAPGDVIPLDQEVEAPLPVFVGAFRKFRGVPGLHGEHLALKLTEVVEEGRDQDE
ncbi:Flagellar motor switch protein FliM signature [Acididesulfobacillus acetoxydans]|uniref:Flagellar motor switch protein FliM n=1 Tax=Acididesulfobacillus acetoxydans TaxID=1561005 RepID=A0A8S0X166_9FIRM|nr:flagellar motor switch protein FliM [Acididesulfobacillus acetoxydans]CAA7602961.1 Flagellar motor switch protein FliM signature [Acididesulfobacillus acetoxydans]CEJ05843.1 Flagellar motor switch protein FliM [Acididesulfobacillus acetoxydans]